MSFRVGDKVVIMDKYRQQASDTISKGQKGIVRDFKWNLVFIEFENGDRDWIEIKKVHIAK